MTVGELLDRMSAREFSEWMIYDELSPIGPERADWRAGMLATVIMKSAGSKRRLKPDDFMPQFRAPGSPSKTPEQMMAALRAALGG